MFTNALFTLNDWRMNVADWIARAKIAAQLNQLPNAGPAEDLGSASCQSKELTKATAGQFCIWSHWLKVFE